MVFEDSKLLKTRKMVDGFCYYDEIRDVVKKQLGLKADDKIKQVSMADVNAAIDDSNILADQIAVYYCSGSIVSTATPSLYGNEEQIVSTTVIKDLQALGDDREHQGCWYSASIRAVATPTLQSRSGVPSVS